jgi:hypothetical protein
MPRRLTVGLIGAVLFAGCGSSSTKTVTVPTSTHTATAGTSPVATTSPPTRAQFIAQADAVCRSLKSQQAPITSKVGELEAKSGTSSKSALVALVLQDVTLARAADAKFAAIPKPPSDVATIEKLLTGYAEEATDLSNFADAYSNGERVAQESASASLKKAIAFDRGVAQGYGLKLCGGISE